MRPSGQVRQRTRRNEVRRAVTAFCAVRKKGLLTEEAQLSRIESSKPSQGIRAVATAADVVNGVKNGGGGRGMAIHTGPPFCIPS